MQKSHVLGGFFEAGCARKIKPSAAPTLAYYASDKPQLLKIGGKFLGIFMHQLSSPTVAIVLIGGFESRSYPNIADTNLVTLRCVDDKPVLKQVIELLARAGIRRCVLVLQKNSDAIVDFLRTVQLTVDIKIETIVEPSPLGAAGAIRYARDTLGIDDQVLLIDGDALVDFDISKLIASAGYPRGAVMCLASRSAPERNRTVTFESDGLISSSTLYPKKSTSNSQAEFVSTGVYLIASKCLDLIPPHTHCSMDLFITTLIAEKLLYATVAANQYFRVNTLEDLQEARKLWFFPPTNSASTYVEKKLWGYKQILSQTEKYSVLRLLFDAGGQTSYHLHENTTKSHYILSGSFLLRTNNGVQSLCPGMEISIAAGVPHELSAITDGAILEITTEQSNDEDIVRIGKGGGSYIFHHNHEAV